MCDFYCTKTIAEPPAKDALANVTALCQKTTLTYTSSSSNPVVRCGKGEIPIQCSSGSFWADSNGNRFTKTTAITTDSLACTTAQNTAVISCIEGVDHESVYVAVSNSVNGVTAPATCDRDGFRPISCTCYSSGGGTCHLSSSGCELTIDGPDSWVQALCRRQSYTYEANANVACKKGQVPLQCGAVSTSPKDKINGAVWSPNLSCTASRARIVCADSPKGLTYAYYAFTDALYADNNWICSIQVCTWRMGLRMHTFFVIIRFVRPLCTNKQRKYAWHWLSRGYV